MNIPPGSLGTRTRSRDAVLTVDDEDARFAGLGPFATAPGAAAVPLGDIAVAFPLRGPRGVGLETNDGQLYYFYARTRSTAAVALDVFRARGVPIERDGRFPVRWFDNVARIFRRKPR